MRRSWRDTNAVRLAWLRLGQSTESFSELRLDERARQVKFHTWLILAVQLAANFRDAAACTLPGNFDPGRSSPFPASFPVLH